MPQPCLFNGVIDGNPVKSFEGEVVHDATPPYCIMKLKIKDDYWMMDLTPMTNTPGVHDYTLVLKKHDGKIFTEHYSGTTTQKVPPNVKAPNICGFFKSSIKVKERSGKEILVQGDFLWDSKRYK